ncbi:MAG: PhnA domain-containing protein [Robiginitomaculum sp.]|nr:PhnA domain-containing protein [Robiginitomaculum sp.]
MTIDPTLLQRAENVCELCTAPDDLSEYVVMPGEGAPAKHVAVLCSTCTSQIDGASLNADHWQCLSTSMWSQTPCVQVLAWRLLSRQASETWAQDLLDMMYLDESLTEWAKAGLPEIVDSKETPTRDSNGAVLQNGDTVTLIKDLAVKGAGFTAKRGTSVRNITLTTNPLHIEGRVNGQLIVLVSAFLKKV